MPLRATPPDADTMRVRAVAELNWGRGADEVELMLVQWGMPRDKARALIAAAMAERHGHFRKKGITDIVLGGAMLAFAIVLFAASMSLAAASASAHSVPHGAGIGKGAIALIVMGVVGMCVFIRGCFRVVLGGRGEGHTSLIDAGDD